MIDKRDRSGNIITYDVSCDKCSTGSETYEVETWNELLEEMKRAGWEIKYRSGDYKHICPTCAWEG